VTRKNGNTEIPTSFPAVFDTVAFTCWLALLSVYRLQIPLGWGSTAFTTPGEVKPFDIILTHNVLDVRLFLKDGVVRKVEAELATVLFGHSARLIQNEPQLVAALVALKTLLQSVCEPYGWKNGYFPGDAPNDTGTYFVRVDLVWQFDIDPGFLFLALRNAKHPDINKRNGEYNNEILVFPGTHLRICAYDKKKKMRAACAHHVVRIEIEYKRNKLCEHLGVGENNPTSLNFATAYRSYRETLLRFRFQPGPMKAGRGAIEEFLAVLQVRYPEDDVIGLYSFIKGHCPRIARNCRRIVGNRVPGLVKFSFEDLLPQSGPPPVVEIQMPRKEAKRDECFEDICHPRQQAVEPEAGALCPNAQ
jgi:hypothetical protein